MSRMYLTKKKYNYDNVEEARSNMKANEILMFFLDKKIHHFDELFCAIKKEFPEKDLTENSLRQMISRLRSKGEIYSVSKNIYAKGKKNIFKPSYDRKMKILQNYIQVNYPEIKFVVWDTNWLNLFSHNYYMKSYKIVEVEKDFEEIIFNHIKEKYPKALLNPSEKEYDLYLDDADVIIVKTLYKRSPISKSETGHYPKIEKILVDTYIERDAFNWLQGIEWERMLMNIIDSCEVDLTTLISYSLYRRNDSVLTNFYTAMGYYKDEKDHYNQYLSFAVKEGDSHNWKLLNENAKKNLMRNCNTLVNTIETLEEG